MGEAFLGAILHGGSPLFTWGKRFWALLRALGALFGRSWALLRALGALFGCSWAFFSRNFDVSQAHCGILLACSGLLWLALAALTEQLELKFKINSGICLLMFA